MPGLLTNGYTRVTPAIPAAGLYPALTGYETLPADGVGGLTGLNPSSVAPTAFQIAALAGSIAVNTATEAANAATLSTLAGRIVTSSLNTAAGATYVITVTNTTCAATSSVQCMLSAGTNTTPGAIVQSVVPGAGSFVATLRNTNATTALNGTVIMAFQVGAT